MEYEKKNSKKYLFLFATCLLVLSLNFLNVNAVSITIINPVNGSELSSDTKSVVVVIETDTNAECKHSLTDFPDYNFDTNGTYFSVTGGTAHSFIFGGLAEDQNYTIYYKCKENTVVGSATHLFSVAKVVPQKVTPPAVFFGTVKIDGNNAPVGTVISAKINGVERGVTTTQISGQYINDSNLTVNGDETDKGKKVKFYINGSKAEQTVIWQSGETELNLYAFKSIPPPLPHILSGTITIDTEPAPIGTVIEAWSTGSMRGYRIVSVVGQYGNEDFNKLVLNGLDGELVTFKAMLPGLAEYATTTQTITIVPGTTETLNLEFILNPKPPVFSGTATVNGEPASDGTIIYAEVDSVERGSTTVQDGNFTLEVTGTPADNNKTIRFFANLAGLADDSELPPQTAIYQSNISEDLNLTFEAHNVKIHSMVLPGTVEVNKTLATSAVIENTQNTDETFDVDLYVDGLKVDVDLYVDGLKVDSSDTCSLSQFESKTVKFYWTSNKTGTYTIEMKIELASDQNTTDDSVSDDVIVKKKKSSSKTDPEEIPVVPEPDNNITEEEVPDEEEDKKDGKEEEKREETVIVIDVEDKDDEPQETVQKTAAFVDEPETGGEEDIPTTPTGFFLLNSITPLHAFIVLALFLAAGYFFLFFIKKKKKKEPLDG